MGYVTKKGGANAICDICGFQFKNFELRRNWKGQMVCEKDFETRHPQELLRPPQPERPLPWTRIDAPRTYGSFLPQAIHEDVSDYTPLVSTTTPTQNGIDFTANVTGYITGVTVFHGALTENKSTYFDQTYVLQIWKVSPPTRLYQARTFYMFPGRWNNIPVTPNVAVTSGQAYVVSLVKISGQPHSYITPHPALPARTLATVNLSVFNSSPNIMPDEIDPTNLPLMDVIIKV